MTDPRELELPDVGLITLVDPETGRRREVWTGDPRLRERYAGAAAAQRAQVPRALRRSGAGHLALRTDRDWTADIVRHVHAQRRLRDGTRPARAGEVPRELAVSRPALAAARAWSRWPPATC